MTSKLAVLAVQFKLWLLTTVLASLWKDKVTHCHTDGWVRVDLQTRVQVDPTFWVRVDYVRYELTRVQVDQTPRSFTVVR